MRGTAGGGANYDWSALENKYKEEGEGFSLGKIVGRKIREERKEKQKKNSALTSHAGPT